MPTTSAAMAFACPVVRHIAQYVLEPALVDHKRSELIAAE
jgi:hypothetical protein